VSTITIASIASTIATNLLGELDAESKKASLRESTNTLIAKLHKDKVTVGRMGKNPCAIAYAFHSTLVAGGVSKGTASNYLTTFKDHVATGKPITDWNKARSDAKNGKGGKGKGKAAFADLFLKAFNHDEGKSFEVLAQEIEIRYLNDEGTVYDLFVSFLEKEGFEISK
jgi:hypothetical protein